MLALKELILRGANRGYVPCAMYREAALLGISERDFYRTLLSLIQREVIPNLLICCCGHDCSRCVTFHATVFDDDALRDRSIAFYGDTFGIALTRADINCLTAYSGTVMTGCNQCPWVRCASEKNAASCAACSSHPCPQLKEYAGKYVNKANQLP